MSAASRARSALDAIRDGEHEQTEAEIRVGTFLAVWQATQPTSRFDVLRDVGAERLLASDLATLLGMIDELRRFPPVVLTGQLPTHRRGDRSTSVAAGTRPDRVRRAGSQALRLLKAYADTDRLAAAADDALPAEYGLTDSEARVAAGISARSCYWKRCSELRADGLIEPVLLDGTVDAGAVTITRPAGNGTERVVARVAAGLRDVTRPDPESGEERIVCRITDAGRRELAKVHAP